MLKPDFNLIIPMYEVLSFLLIGIILIRIKSEYYIYNIDGFTLSLILLFRTILFSNKYGNNFLWDLAYLSFWVIAICIVYNNRSTYPPFFSTNNILFVKWILIIVVAGIILPNLVFSFLARFSSSVSNNNSILAYLAQFFSSLGNETIDEEPLFRGFLWGMLRKFGWQENRIWLFQAFLFGIAHYSYWEIPLFWFLTLMLGMLSGFFVWRSRSVSTGMVFHSAYNALNTFFR